MGLTRILALKRSKNATCTNVSLPKLSTWAGLPTQPGRQNAHLEVEQVEIPRSLVVVTEQLEAILLLALRLQNLRHPHLLQQQEIQRQPLQEPMELLVVIPPHLLEVPQLLLLEPLRLLPEPLRPPEPLLLLLEPLLLLLEPVLLPLLLLLLPLLVVLPRQQLDKHRFKITKLFKFNSWKK